MPCVILVGVFNTNTPQQNAGSFFGEYNVGGWDANMKLCQGHGGLYGFFNWHPVQVNVNFDNFELIDGAINDADLKPSATANV
ncbi:hypothetical protein C7445_10356 [Alicyclobacillus sacchari]|uniref:Uncharacterized protein n=1 Tax=Alicyclobacillus sacchari TaxID=392010 RepID=A0A4R8LR16_9BACL|nr:hypothetical protein [Alicyclobacillus sacchari]TDY50013.1 hypothetical protein C7445_10356 [Alicyclobacillus sacchari]GMA57667.1 hypothetical protein GCM10025858_21700 [Alicyclobacillus sacchari]